MVMAVLAAAAPAAAGTLWVAFPSGADPCGYDQLAAALHARLGEVSVRPGVHDATGDDVDVALERAGSDWGLRVKAGGERELERKLPKPGTDCVATTETAALMVERYLEDIRWTGGGAVVSKLPPLPPPPPPPRWQMVVEVGGAGSSSFPSRQRGWFRVNSLDGEARSTSAFGGAIGRLKPLERTSRCRPRAWEASSRAPPIAFNQRPFSGLRFQRSLRSSGAFRRDSAPSV